MRIHHSFARNFRERRLGAIFVRSLEPVVAKRDLRRTQESPSQHRCPNTRQPLSHPLVSSAPQRASQAITSDAPPSLGFSSPSCVPIVRGTANSGCAPFVECGGLVYPVYPELRLRGSARLRRCFFPETNTPIPALPNFRSALNSQ